MQATTDGAADQRLVADPFRSATVLDQQTPPPARPGTVKPQHTAETLRLYAGDWAHFQEYCAERGLKSLPASPELVCAFLARRTAALLPARKRR